MGIGDWRSDVCSSDLVAMGVEMRRAGGRAAVGDRVAALRADGHVDVEEAAVDTDIRLLGGDIGRRSIAADGARLHDARRDQRDIRSEEHTSELQSLMRTSYAVFRLKKKST